jgi:hypothetical protein
MIHSHVNQDGSAMKTEPSSDHVPQKGDKSPYPRLVRASFCYTSGVPNPHVVLGYAAEGFKSYHPGDVGRDIKESSIVKTLIGLSWGCSYQPL